MLAAASLAGAGGTKLDFDGRDADSLLFADALAGAALPPAPYIKAFTRDSQDNDLPDGERSLGFVPPVYDTSNLTGRSIVPAGKRGAEVFPDHYDLRVLGKVSPVKDQGNCGGRSVRPREALYQ